MMFVVLHEIIDLNQDAYYDDDPLRPRYALLNQPREIAIQKDCIVLVYRQHGTVETKRPSLVCRPGKQNRLRALFARTFGTLKHHNKEMQWTYVRLCDKSEYLVKESIDEINQM